MSGPARLMWRRAEGGELHGQRLAAGMQHGEGEEEEMSGG